MTNSPLKLSRVPSLSLLIWWHTEQVTPSSASAALAVLRRERQECEDLALLAA